MNMKSNSSQKGAFILLVMGVLAAGIYIISFKISEGINSSVNGPDDTMVPCGGNPASRFALGRFISDDLSNEFTTKGGELFVTAKTIRGGGVGWIPLEKGRLHGTLYIGQSGKMLVPNYDEYKKHAIITIDAWDDGYNKISLPPGHYWIWGHRFKNIELVSCISGNISEILNLYEKDNEKRRSDFIVILDSIELYVKNTGNLPPEITKANKGYEATQYISSDGANICPYIISDTYGLPMNPKLGDGSKITKCPAVYNTGYFIRGGIRYRNPAGYYIVVSARDVENDRDISETRIIESFSQ